MTFEAVWVAEGAAAGVETYRAAGRCPVSRLAGIEARSTNLRHADWGDRSVRDGPMRNEIRIVSRVSGGETAPKRRRERLPPSHPFESKGLDLVG